MYTFNTPSVSHDWEMDMQDLERITKETYGIGFDIQMGERGQGTHITTETIGTGEEHDVEGYRTGMVCTVYGSVDYAKSFDAKFIELTPEKSIERWVALKDAIKANEGYKYTRPFEKVNPETGEYYYYQPSVSVVLQDMFNKGLIPAGRYRIYIDW